MVVMEILTAPWEACKIMAVIVASVVCVFAGGWGGKLFYLYTDPEFTWGGAMDRLVFSGELWQLDWLFWYYGVLTLAVAYGFAIALVLLWRGLKATTKAFLSRLLWVLFCCCLCTRAPTQPATSGDSYTPGSVLTRDIFGNV